MTPYDPAIVTSDALAQVEPYMERQDDEELLRIAKERFKRSAEAENEWRVVCQEDLEFYQGEQWNPDIKAKRREDNRPCLTINRLPGFVHQVTNEVRQQKPSPKVSPVDNTGDIETAEVLQGIYRHIERQSKADSVRSYAAFYQVVCGRGYYRIITEYTDPLSRDQDIYIKRIKNPLCVYMDPTCQEPDYSDAWYGFIISDMTREEYEAEYPDEEVESAEEFHSIGDGDPDWASHDKVRVAEYFYREMEQMPVADLQDGTTVPLERVPPGTPVVGYRTAQVPKWRWCKHSASKVLARGEWPSQYHPIIVVLGEEYDVNGSTEMVGMVRNAKDPQRMLNYWESAKTETIALAPRSPYIAAEGQLENHENEWAQANVKNYSVLHYKPKSLDGTVLPAPQRQVYEPPIQAISVAEGGAVDHLKATTGIYDASLGNRSNETSGIAIRQRTAQGDVANYHYADNLSIAITYEAKVIIDLIPKIYDRPGRVARIIGEDGSERQVQVNQEFNDHGIARIYDLQTGRYDVAVDIGPSYKTRRQEAADSMLGFAQAAPELVPRYADLFVQAMDWPGAQEIADRVRPPDAPPKGGEKRVPPQVQAMMQQLQQQNQQLTEALNQATELINTKQQELDSKERINTQQVESKERIAAQQSAVDVSSKLADLGSKEAIALLNAQVLSLAKRMDMLQADQPVQQEQPQVGMPQQMAGPQEMGPVGPVGPPSGPNGRPPLESFEM